MHHFLMHDSCELCLSGQGDSFVIFGNERKLFAECSYSVDAWVHGDEFQAFGLMKSGEDQIVKFD